MNEPSAATPAVELRGVCKNYGPRVVLDRVDLTIRPGEIVALLGPSGSGKSTLLKMISGIERPAAGSVWLGGRDVTAAPPYRRPVHTVFQNYALFPHLNVAANIAFPLRVAGAPRLETRQRVKQALGWVRLEDHEHRRVDTLSGGERQRVALARALVGEPRCVLLDEPLSALDPRLRQHTLAWLREVQARLGATYLYVTHDREEALRVAHRVAVLRQGRLEQVGPPAEVYLRPLTPYVAAFVGPIHWLTGEVFVHANGPAFRLPGGDVIPLPAAAHAPAGSARLGVRPESVRLGAAGYFSARVVGKQFAGASLEVTLQTDHGARLGAEVRVGDETPAVGDTTRVGWPTEAAHVFAEAAFPPSTGEA